MARAALWRVLALAWLCLWAACTRPEADGPRYEVRVLAPADRLAALAPVLDSLFAERWICSPPEAKLAWRWGDPQDPDAVLASGNLLILLDQAARQTDGPVERLAAQVLGTDALDRVRAGHSLLVHRDNAFAHTQRLVVLAAPDAATFREACRARAAEVRGMFLLREESRERLALKTSPLQKELQDSLALACGFKLDLPPEWFLVQGGMDPPFVRLRRLDPDAWLTVAWREGADSLYADPGAQLAMRTRLGAQTWEKDQTLPSPLRRQELRLNGLPASCLEGLWREGGRETAHPFLFYTVHVPGAAGLSQGRTFYIDAALRCLGDRSPWLHQLRQLAASFVGTNAEGKPIGPLQTKETDE